ncbi:MAG: hypothetical protein CMJ64_20385 [Planctomycetaceae bacterium]|nr:hypothetical protein [Planctomycetaceae bacterium]
MSHRFDDLAPMFPDQNPFSTWAVRPGAIVFRFVNGSSRESVLTKLEENGWWGEVVGPHGSGKSTLLATLAPGFEERGRTVKRYVVKLGEKQLAINTLELRKWTPNTQVVVEGFEKLGRRNRKMIETVCKRQQAGLLVTCHESLGFPALLQTSISLELGISLVRDLLPPDCDFISDDDVRRSYERHRHNLRELLFEMYDLYEKRRPRDG